MSESNSIESQPIEELLKIINKKWTILTVLALGNYKRVRFNELRRELSGISPKTLIETLRELERLGVSKSEQFLEIPPKVEYYLTDDGISFRDTLMPLVRWMARKSSITGSQVVTIALRDDSER